MQNYLDKVSTVRECIAEAFKKSAPPQNLLVEPRADYEDLLLMDDFGSRPWQSLPYKIVRRNYAALPCMTDSAYRFYLPAFMTAGIDRISTAKIDNTLLDFTTYSLIENTCNDDVEAHRVIEKLVRLFSPLQVQAIAEFLSLSECFHFTHGDSDFAERIKKRRAWWCS